MGDSLDKRNFPRAKANLQVRVESGGKTQSGEVLNLTVEGIAFTLGVSLAPGSRVDLELVSSDDNIESNTLQAEILRCEAGSSEPPYQISAKLIDANDQFLMDALALVHGRKT